MVPKSLLWFPVCASAARFTEYIIAPDQRSLKPQALYAVNGNVSNPTALCQDVPDGIGTTFIGLNSSITFDFGMNVAGTVDFDVRSLSGEEEYLGFTFTESSMWISPYQCDSGSTATYDSPLWFKVPANGHYAADKAHQRGGFRYMSVWHNSTGNITLGNLSVNFTASPNMGSLKDYAGYFNSDNEKLNRVWYAGAYTNQLCTIDPAYGNALGIPGTDWYYNATISNGTSVLVDGAKRDRLVWPGDIAISAPSIFVSTNNLASIMNAIDSLFVLQQPDGRLPWAGTPFTGHGQFPFSFTYHLYTLLDVFYYYLYTDEISYLKKHWDQYKLAMAWSLGTIDSSGMANVSSSNDWLRSGMGGHNVEANAIFYHTLGTGIKLAEAIGDQSVIDGWTSSRSSIKTAVNNHLWDPVNNLFFDNDLNRTADSLQPQDGNSWAVVSGIVDADRAAAISTSLMQRWVRPYGAPAPEAGPTISPFASGFEVQAHFLAGFPERAHELIEFMWADFMLNDPRMTNSSFIEGYSTNGDLHYAPYDNDARISHAHGWSTGPTSALTFFSAGLQLASAAGRTWLIQPRLGGLKRVTAGYKTPLGEFSVEWTASNGTGLSGIFMTPVGTSGTLILPATESMTTLKGQSGSVQPSRVEGSAIVFTDLPGGTYKVEKD